ncbi:hypothetical protein GS907_26390 [Rhodococcus hoagii]|nr:hypothetical protein [Prescottella equi]
MLTKDEHASGDREPVAVPRAVVAGTSPVAGLELDIEHHGTTQTYGRRDFDAARIAVLDYLAVTDTPVAADTVIEWVETGR